MPWNGLINLTINQTSLFYLCRSFHIRKPLPSMTWMREKCFNKLNYDSTNVWVRNNWHLFVRHRWETLKQSFNQSLNLPIEIKEPGQTNWKHSWINLSIVTTARLMFCIASALLYSCPRVPAIFFLHSFLDWIIDEIDEFGNASEVLYFCILRRPNASPLL